jgi:hypothetical protein
MRTALLLSLTAILLCTYSHAQKVPLIPRETNGGWCFTDSTGKTVFEVGVDFADHFSCGMARVKNKGKWGFIDTAGNIIVPLIYDRAENGSEGFAVVAIQKGCRNYRWKITERYFCRERYGLANRKGEVVFLEYSFIKSFNGGYAKVFKTPWWKVNWNVNIDWKKIDHDLVEYDIPE